jgi:Arc/MetJ-type ribon-helix-helix transcriptional regulator
MTEIRVTITEKMNDLLEDVVEAGMFASKADAMRAAAVFFLKDLGWLERPKSSSKRT